MSLWASEVIESVALESPATFKEALGNLEILSEIIRERLVVDQVKTYLVRRSPKGPVWWLLTTPRGGRTIHIEYDPHRGLADYVIRTHEGFLAVDIPAVPVPGPKGGPLIRASFFVGRSKGERTIRPDTVEARSDDELEGKGFVLDGPVNPESTLLYMPVRTDSKVSAVIGVSRSRGADESAADPLTLEDADLLEAVSPALAMACQRCLHLEKLDEHFGALTSLGRELGACESLPDGYSIAARVAGGFAEATAAALLEQLDVEDTYLSLGVWQTPERSEDSAPLQLPAAVSSLEEAKRALADQLPRCEFRQKLAAETHSGKRKRILLLFDGNVPGPELSYSSDRLFERYSEIFFQSACEALDGFVGRLGNRVADQLVGPQEESNPQTVGTVGGPPGGNLALLGRTAELLKTTTGVDRIRIVSGREGHRILGAAPESSSTLPMSLPRDRWRQLQAGIRIWETALIDPNRETDPESPLAQASWSRRVLPVLFGERLVGAVELFSGSTGSPVGQDHGDLAEAVARQASWEVRRALRHAALERINHDLGRIWPAQGQNLGRNLAQALRQWAREIFVRPTCEVVILARSLRSGALIAAGTLELPLGDIRPGHQLLTEGALWSKTKGVAPPMLHHLGGSGISVPIQISADPRLQGFIAILDEESFEEEEREIWSEAARFLAVFLQGEREKNDIRRDMGLFRHAVLGAIQGLTSSGLALAELATDLEGDAGASAEIWELQRVILRESEQLRLWRENQRFYLDSSSRPELRRRQQAVKPLLESYLQRYRPAAEVRGLRVHREMPPREFQLSLDEKAFDVAVSNLLDNAVKYAFENQEITLGMAPQGDGVRIWVEDIGHGIPEGAAEDIFIRDQRLHRRDPFRIIAGQGLGLALVKSIIEAHDGQIRVTSRQVRLGKTTETTPFRVRFTIELPWSR